MAFSPEANKTLAVTVAENIASDPDSVSKAFADLESQLGKKMIDLSYDAYFGMTLFDGRAFGIETFLEKIGNLSDIIFVGGYASDDFQFSHIRVFANGKSYENAAVLAVFQPAGKFSLVKTQSALPTKHSFIVTKADEAQKVISP